LKQVMGMQNLKELIGSFAIFSSNLNKIATACCSAEGCYIVDGFKITITSESDDGDQEPVQNGDERITELRELYNKNLTHYFVVHNNNHGDIGEAIHKCIGLKKDEIGSVSTQMGTE
jgi:hypothetical protein